MFKFVANVALCVKLIDVFRVVIDEECSCSRVHVDICDGRCTTESFSIDVLVLANQMRWCIFHQDLCGVMCWLDECEMEYGSDEDGTEMEMEMGWDRDGMGMEWEGVGLRWRLRRGDKR